MEIEGSKKSKKIIPFEGTPAHHALSGLAKTLQNISKGLNQSIASPIPRMSEYTPGYSRDLSLLAKDHKFEVQLEGLNEQKEAKKILGALLNLTAAAQKESKETANLAKESNNLSNKAIWIAIFSIIIALLLEIPQAIQAAQTLGWLS